MNPKSPTSVVEVFVVRCKNCANNGVITLLKMKLLLPCIRSYKTTLLHSRQCQRYHDANLNMPLIQIGTCIESYSSISLS